jgi:hypothetical protein
VADEVQIKFGADIGGAVSALSTLKSAVAGAVAPVVQLKAAFAETETAIQHAGNAGLAIFKSEMQELVAARALSLRQALGFDIEYTARQSDEERARLEQVLANDAASLADKAQTFRQLIDLSNRYSVEVARDQARLAEAARHEADRLAQPYRQAFDEIGAGWRTAVKGLVEGTASFGVAATEILRSVERGIVDMLGATVSKLAAGPLAGLLGQPSPGIGEGVGDVLGNTVSRWIFGLPQGLGPTDGSWGQHRRAHRQYGGPHRADRHARRFGGDHGRRRRRCRGWRRRGRIGGRGGRRHPRFPRQPVRVRQGRHRAVGGRRLGVAEFCRHDAGAVACARDGAAGIDQRRPAEHDRRRRRQWRRQRSASAFPRPLRRARG